jgi:hypothetical protein
MLPNIRRSQFWPGPRGLDIEAFIINQHDTEKKLLFIRGPAWGPLILMVGQLINKETHFTCYQVLPTSSGSPIKSHTNHLLYRVPTLY